MNTQDVDVIGEVLRQALAGHREVLEALIATRTADAITAERAAEVARDACDAAEERLRASLKFNKDEVVATLQQAAAEDVARLREELAERASDAERITESIRHLRRDLAQATDALAAAPGVEDTLAAIREDEGMRDLLRGAPGDKGTPGDPGAHGAGIEAPVWAPGIYRAGTTVQAYFGQYYRAHKDTAAEPYASEEWERIGTAGFHMAEPYTEGRTYTPGDLFVRDFGTFLQGPAGAILLAGRGPKGEQGPRGEKGRDGTNGKDGRHGAGITHAELRGYTLALVVRAADGSTDALTVDFAPALEKFGSAMEDRLVALLAERMPT